MEVLGRRSEAGIWWVDTRRSWRGVRFTLDVAIIDEDLENAKNERMKLSNKRKCKRSERALRRTLFRAMN